MPGLDSFETVEPVIDWPIDLDHQHPPFNQLHERNEQLAVKAVYVNVPRRSVGGGDDLDSALEQLAEQPRQDHRVGGIGHLHLVEAEEAGLGRNLLCYRFDRIAFLGTSGVPPAAMRLQREGMEVNPPLR